jgi:hypothetical protein
VTVSILSPDLFLSLLPSQRESKTEVALAQESMGFSHFGRGALWRVITDEPRNGQRSI